VQTARDKISDVERDLSSRISASVLLVDGIRRRLDELEVQVSLAHLLSYVPVVDTFQGRCTVSA
jgi:hypothetical protein